jgi:ribonuclease inhibitor
MKEIRLNGAKMVDKIHAHTYLKRKLSLPEYYGENLDALWDCLASEREERTIVISKPSVILNHLGAYGERLINLFIEASEANPSLEVVIEDEPGLEPNH